MEIIPAIDCVQNVGKKLEYSFTYCIKVMANGFTEREGERRGGGKVHIKSETER